MHAKAKLCLGVCGLIVLIVSCILLAVSFALLHPHEYGLPYNSVTHTIEYDVKENGRYFLGLGRRFIKYPKKMEYVEFSNSFDGGINNPPVSAWTADGQDIELDVGFYFQLRRESIPEMYLRYQDNFLTVIEQIGAAAFREAATRYETTDFFEKRNEINDAMHLTLRRRLNHTVFADVPRFNLLDIRVPGPFETAVVDKVVKAQEKNILQFEQQSAVISQTIAVLQAAAERDIRIITAEAEANATIITEQARADVFANIVQERARQHRDLALALGFVRSDNASLPNIPQLMNYLYLELMRGSDTSAAQVIVDYNKAFLPEVLQS